MTSTKPSPVSAGSRAMAWLATVALVALVVAVPIVLWVVTGNPFTDWSLVAARRSLTSNQAFDPALVSHWFGRCAVALSWLAWTWMTVCVALEVRARMTGRSTRRLPASRTLQSVAACLVGSALAMSSVGRAAPAPIIVAVGHGGQGHAHGNGPAHLVAGLHRDAAGRALIGGVVPIIEDRDPLAEGTPVLTPMGCAAVMPPDLRGARADERAEAPVDGRTETATHRHGNAPTTTAMLDPSAHRVGPRETLWSIAAERLGSAKRWREIAELNYGAVQLDGSSLAEDHWVRPGWLLMLPTQTKDEVSARPRRDPSSAASSPGKADKKLDEDGAHCPIVDTDIVRHNPWSRFPEENGIVPRPGKPLPAVPLGGGIVGAGVIDLVDRLRRIQQRHREDGSFIKLPDRLRSQFERRLRAGEGASGPEAIDAALQLLALSWDRRAWPSVRGAKILPDSVELVVDLPGGRGRIPQPFEDVEGLLRVDRALLSSRHRRPGRDLGRAPVPTLVTVGTAGIAGGGVLLVDLESLGSLVVSGDRAGCENVIRALALELATSHWSGRFDVVLVGFGAEFERFDRVRSVSDPQQLVLELCRRRLRGDALRTNAMVDSFAAARWIDDDICWAPLVVVCGPAVAENAVRELFEVGSDPLGGTAVVAVGAAKGGSGAAHSVRLTGGGSSAPLELLAAVLRPQQVDAGEFAEVTAILDVAEEMGSAPPSDDPYRDLQVPLPAALPPASPPDPPPPGSVRAVPFDRGRGPGELTAPVPERARPHVADETSALDAVERISVPGGRDADQSGQRPSDLRVRPVRDDPEPRPELREVEVLVLGPVELRGAAREFTRAWAKELVVYLAMHPRGASNEAWATALWPDRLMAPSSLHSTASVARRALGRARDGVDHLPRSHGRLALGPTVGTDWDRFVRLADGGRPARWRSALDLVRGRPFEGLRSSDWPILEGIGPAIESSVVDLSGRLAGACLRAGDARGAEWSARKGLLVSPYDERLYRMLLRAADLAGNPAGVEAVMAELVRLVAEGVEPLESVHPSTLQLYRSLTRRKPVPRAGPALPASTTPRRGDATGPEGRSEGAAS
jgi:DNA-binding SARP family transcriptional activator